MLGEASLSDWDLARTYARGGRTLLTESQRGRGRLLMEGLLQGLADAAGWIGVKVGSAAAKLKQLGKDALESAGKALTALLEKIPGGEAAFEMLKDFSSDTAEKIGDYIKDALVEFADFLVEKKDAILTAVFKGAADPGIATKIKELAEKAAEGAKDKADEIKGFIDSIVNDPAAAVKALFGSRETLGELAKKIVEVILSSSEKVKGAITGAIMKVEFFSTKPGKLVMRLMTLMSADMGGEQVIVAASRVWKSIKGIGKTGVSLDHVGREFRDALPDVVKGLVGGEGAVEQIIRSAVGDPSAAAKLMKNSIKMCFNALKKLVDSNMEDALKKIGLDPEGKVGKAVAAGVGALVGAAGGAAGVEESRRRRPRARLTPR